MLRSLLLPVAALAMVASQATAQTPQGQARPPAMALTATAWPDGGDIPLKYTQATPDVADYPLGVSPELTWTNTPAGTASFVLLFHDPDVARDRTTEDQLHWLLWNIPGSATRLPENLPAGDPLPDGTRQTSVSGTLYRGPGAGAAGPRHHYTFELFALDTRLDVQPAATPAETRAAVMRAMNGHILGKAVYVGLFRRPQ